MKFIPPRVGVSRCAGWKKRPVNVTGVFVRSRITASFPFPFLLPSFPLPLPFSTFTA